MPEKPKFRIGEQRILDAIISNPGKTDKEIAKILGWTVLTVHSSTGPLESGRAISIVMQGFTEIYYPCKEEPPVVVGPTVAVGPVAGSLSKILTEVLKKNNVQTSRELL